ncbi:MAG: RNA polymerase sigma factor [Lentisphaeria bacterium]|nr:RNA polymerase sigma factor [Lentisphaeria bacterium]
MQTSSDEELVRRLMETGDSVWFDPLVQRHMTRIRRLAGCMMGNNSDVDDVTQMAFLKAYNSLGSFRGNARFSTWLTRIAINVVKDHLATHNRRSRLTAGLAPLHEESQAASPGVAAESRDRLREVGGALDRLSPRLRSAIVLTVMEGLSVAEVAEIEQCATATIHWRVHQARKQLKTALAKQ